LVIEGGEGCDFDRLITAGGFAAPTSVVEVELGFGSESSVEVFRSFALATLSGGDGGVGAAITVGGDDGGGST
jgi:hypothetical protein